jgi:hypothetical protein
MPSMTEAQMQNAINRIDKRLDWIEEALGRVVELQYVPMGRSEVRPDASGVPDDVLELVRAGRKMEAMKRYHEVTGVDLAQARQVLEDL